MIQRVKAIAQVWPSVLRVVVGVYWLYFGSQKWHGIDWMQGLMKGTADANPIPGLHELLTVTRALRRVIQSGGRIDQVLSVALDEGMHTLRQDGIEKVLAGLTTIEEVRATSNV